MCSVLVGTWQYLINITRTSLAAVLHKNKSNAADNNKWFCTPGLEGLRFFTRKMSENQWNIRGVCRCHASINLFWLRKIWIVLFVTKQYQPFCVNTWGDALMKLPCSGLLSSIEVGLCYLRKWRRGESLLFILKQAQSMKASVYSRSSTGQNSTVKW